MYVSVMPVQVGLISETINRQNWTMQILRPSGWQLDWSRLGKRSPDFQPKPKKEKKYPRYPEFYGDCAYCGRELWKWDEYDDEVDVCEACEEYYGDELSD
jgi:hypothetical protein